MVELVNVFCGGIGSFLKAIMGKSIHDDMIMIPNETLDDSKSSEPARRINQQ
jgi:hypothetical protein